VTTPHRVSSGTIVTVVVLAAVLSWVTYIQFFNPQREVRWRMNDVASALSTAREGTDLARLARVMRLKNYLTDDVHVTGDGRQIDSRDDVMNAAARWATAGAGVSVDFIDLSVTMSPDGASAESFFTAEISSAGPGSNEPTVQARDVIADLVHRNGEWLIARVEAKPPQP
jgi:hypothetical protein